MNDCNFSRKTKSSPGPSPNELSHLVRNIRKDDCEIVRVHFDKERDFCEISSHEINVLFFVLSRSQYRLPEANRSIFAKRDGSISSFNL